MGLVVDEMSVAAGRKGKLKFLSAGLAAIFLDCEILVIAGVGDIIA